MQLKPAHVILFSAHWQMWFGSTYNYYVANGPIISSQHRFCGRAWRTNKCELCELVVTGIYDRLSRRLTRTIPNPYITYWSQVLLPTVFPRLRGRAISITSYEGHSGECRCLRHSCRFIDALARVRISIGIIYTS